MESIWARDSVELCRQKGLQAEVADFFVYLAELPEGSLDGIFCAQVVEHLPPERIAGDGALGGWRLQRDGILAIETPNPECLAIFASHFYSIRRTHARCRIRCWRFTWRRAGWVGSRCNAFRRLSNRCPPWRPAGGFPRCILRRTGLRNHREEAISRPGRIAGDRDQAGSGRRSGGPAASARGGISHLETAHFRSEYAVRYCRGALCGDADVCCVFARREVRAS